MKHINNLRQKSLALTLSTLLLSGCSSFFLGDENLSEPVDLPSSPALVGLQQQWQRSIGDGTDEKALKLQPLILPKQIVAVSADGELTALSHDGSRLWETDTGHSIAAGVSGSESTLVVGSENGLLMAFATANGSRRWTYQLSTEMVSPATVIGGLVVARTIDGQVVALSEKTGRPVWKQHLGVAELSIRGNASALFFDGAFLFTNAKGRVTILSATDGKRLLDTPVSRGRGVTAVERVADLLATPTIRGGVLFVSAYRHETLAVGLKDGKLLWRSPIATALDLFADNRYLYVVDKNSLIHALDLRSGKPAWVSRIAEGRRISPIAGNGRYIVTVDNEGKLLVLNSNDGSLLGYRDVGNERTYVAPQWLNGQWLTYSSDGTLSLTSLSKTGAR